MTPVLATIGVDMSSGLSTSTNWGCLAQNGYQFAIIQTWQGGYGFNNGIAGAIAASKAAGFLHTDVYIFMCPNCGGNGNPEAVVTTVVNAIQGQPYGMIWFDIEQCTDCWFDADTNANYIARAANQAVSMGQHIGFYSSEYEWSQTMGGHTDFAGYPLWYAHWDGVQSFSDGLYQFGGWTSPAIKQYADSGPCCSVDSSWYPDSMLEWRAKVLNTTQPLINLSKMAAPKVNLTRIAAQDAQIGRSQHVPIRKP